MNLKGLQETPSDRALAEFAKDRKEFLERNAERFYKAYQTTKDSQMLKLYRLLLQERQKC